MCACNTFTNYPCDTQSEETCVLENGSYICKAVVGEACEDLVFCAECLEAEGCGAWTGGACSNECLQDVSCFTTDTFPDKNVEETCQVAADNEADAELCSSRTECGNCVGTTLLDGETTCQWFENESFCASGCTLGACGETTCNETGDKEIGAATTSPTKSPTGAPTKSPTASPTVRGTTSPPSASPTASPTGSPAVSPAAPKWTVISSTTSSVPSSEKVELSCVFANEWSAVNHPIDYPSSNAHWSPMLLAAHSKDYQMWAEGVLASPGVVSVAEVRRANTGPGC